MLSGKAADTIFYSLNRTGIEATTFRSQWEYTDHYTTMAVDFLLV
jgi:hypothetical protein